MKLLFSILPLIIFGGNLFGDDKLSDPEEIPITVISIQEADLLRAIRDKYAPIQNLETLYEDRVHPNGLPYHVYIPEALEPGKAYPMVTFLHGYSDLAVDIHAGIPKGIWSLPRVQSPHPHVLFLPRGRTLDDAWAQPDYRKMVMQAMDDFVREMNDNPDTPNIDVNRLYLTGFSMGGRGTWNYIRNAPGKFAAAAPLSGFSDGPQSLEEAMEIRHIPIWIFNGDGDRGVEGSSTSYRFLKLAEAPDVRYHEYKEQGHVIDDFAYFTDGFMDWLFAQSLERDSSKP